MSRACHLDRTSPARYLFSGSQKIYPLSRASRAPCREARLGDQRVFLSRLVQHRQQVLIVDRFLHEPSDRWADKSDKISFCSLQLSSKATCRVYGPSKKERRLERPERTYPDTFLVVPPRLPTQSLVLLSLFLGTHARIDSRCRC
jgi:hypothetical protein